MGGTKNTKFNLQLVSKESGVVRTILNTC